MLLSVSFHIVARRLPPCLPHASWLQAFPIVTKSPLPHLRPQAQSIQCADSMGPSAGAAGRPTPAPSTSTSVDGIQMTQDGFGDGAASSGPKVGTGWARVWVLMGWQCLRLVFSKDTCRCGCESCAQGL